MRVKDQFVLQEVADDFIVVPISEEAERLKGVIKLNEAGATLWKYMTEKDATVKELAEILVSDYGIDQEKAGQDASDFINQLQCLGCFD